MTWLELLANIVGGIIVFAVWVMIAAMVIGFIVSVPGYIREIYKEKLRK